MNDTISDLESAVITCSLRDYEPEMSGAFTTTTTLKDAINKPDITASTIMKWEWQITECLRHCFIISNQCPILNTTDKILVNSRNDIVSNSVIEYCYNKDFDSDVVFTDTVMRVHGTIVSLISYNSKLASENSSIALLSIIGTYFYASAASRATTFSTSEVCEFAEQLCEMVELGLLNTLGTLFNPSNTLNTLDNILKFHTSK